MSAETKKRKRRRLSFRAFSISKLFLKFFFEYIRLLVVCQAFIYEKPQYFVFFRKKRLLAYLDFKKFS